jgi:hypothetical protein
MNGVRATWFFLFLLATACNNESTSCDGILVGNQCHECPGKMVNGVCITGGTDAFVPECTIDEECLPVSVCLDGVCGQECTKDADCPGILQCSLYRCVTAGSLEDVVGDMAGAIPCLKHIDCDPYDMACIGGFCDRECTKDWHCDGPGGKCVGFMCQSGLPADIAPGDVVQPLDTTATDTKLPPNCDPTDGPYGAACHCKQECASALCIENKITNSAICTQFCQNDAQCPGPDFCVAVDTTSVCILNDSGQATSCNPDEVFCYKGLFLTNKLGKCACTALCNKAADCPEGFGCHAVGADKVCVSTGETCGSGYNPCFGQCAGNPNTGLGFCTNICISSTDCPDGWTCQPLAEGVSVCASPF